MADREQNQGDGMSGSPGSSSSNYGDESSDKLSDKLGSSRPGSTGGSDSQRSGGSSKVDPTSRPEFGEESEENEGGSTTGGTGNTNR